MVKKVGKYEMFKTLGEGTFGKVKYSVNTETNDACAIKVLDKEQIQKLNMGNQIKKEISIMKMVRHKYIVGMKEVLASKTKIFIVLELVTGGELFDKIVSVGRFNEQKARFYFQQLVEGVEYCHSMGVCHRDLKPENLLVDEHGNLKISDFGLSSLYVGDAESGANRTEILHTTCGTPNYVAPEVLADAGYDGKKADAWSMGVILYVLLARFLPFDETTITALFVKIQAADYTFPSWFSAEVRDFLSHVMTADPKTRISVVEMKTHAWVAMPAATPSDATDEPPAAIPRTYAEDGSVIWTQEQLEAAVESTMEDSTTASAASYHQHDDDDDEDATAPRLLNAFDLVSQCGGFALNRMFCPKTFSPILTDQEEASIITKHQRSFQYSSNLAPADLYAHTITALGEMKFKVTKFETLFKFKATLLTGKGMIGLSGQVFLLTGTDGLCLLEFRRGKGDMMEFRSALEELVNKRMLTHINIASSEEEAKSSSA